MKRFFLIAFLVIFVGILAIYFLRAPILSLYLSKKLKVGVSMSSISLGKSSIKIKGFKIKNPRGYKERVAFLSDEIEINYIFSKFFEDPSIINSLIIRGNYLNIVCNNPLCSDNNWSAIMSKEKGKKDAKEVIIRKLEIDNLDVDITGMGIVPGAKKKKHISHISFSNISSKRGFPTSELIRIIFEDVGLQDLIKDVLDKKDTIERFIDTFKRFGKKSQEAD